MICTTYNGHRGTALLSVAIQSDNRELSPMFDVTRQTTGVEKCSTFIYLRPEDRSVLIGNANYRTLGREKVQVCDLVANVNKTTSC